METKQFNALMQVIAKLSSAVEELSVKIDVLAEKVDALERKVDALELRVGALERRMDSLEHRVGKLEKETKQGFAAIRAEAKAESKVQAEAHYEILQAFDAPFVTLEHDHIATKTNHGKRISKLERHIS